MALGRASVLYTFYPPLVGNPFYYIGVVLVVVGSWIWVALMAVNLRLWKRDNPGRPVPLAMFAATAGAYLWGWTAVGAAIESVVPHPAGGAGAHKHDQCRPGARVLLLDSARHRLFLADPGFIAYYTIIPRAIGGRLFSDQMGRLAFALFLVVSMPIGIHHLFMDPRSAPASSSCTPSSPPW